MTERYDIYRCEICGNVVETIDNGKGTLVCCNQDMKRMDEKGKDEELQEKHVPVIEKDSDKIVVSIGSIPHPMQDNHYIQMIEIMKDGKIAGQKTLGPKDKPKAEFCLDDAEGVKARAYCNVHGLWKS